MSIKSIRTFSLFLVIVSSAATAGGPAISKGLYKKISNTSLHHIVMQDGINVMATSNNLAGSVGSGGGGFFLTALASMIDSSVEEKSRKVGEKKLESIKNQLKDFDYRGQFNSQLKSILDERVLKRGLLDIKSFSTGKESVHDVLNNYYNTGSGMLLTLNTSYYFDEAFRTLTVSTNIMLHDRTIWQENKEGEAFPEEYDEKSPILYRSNVMYLSKTMPASENYEKYWNEENRLRNTLNESIAILPEMIVENLENAVKSEPSGESYYWEVTLNSRPNLVIPAELIKQNGDRVIVKDDRNFFNTYMSLHKDHRYVPKPEPENESEDDF